MSHSPKGLPIYQTGHMSQGYHYDFLRRKTDMRRKKTRAVPVNTEVLPAPSVTNVHELLRALMPLKHLTEGHATERVIEHLLNRTRSRKSRIKKTTTYEKCHVRLNFILI
jgi:hypothetical protein